MNDQNDCVSGKSKIGGVFSSITRTVKEISHEIKRDLQNMPPVGMASKVFEKNLSPEQLKILISKLAGDADDLKPEEKRVQDLPHPPVFGMALEKEVVQAPRATIRPQPKQKTEAVVIDNTNSGSKTMSEESLQKVLLDPMPALKNREFAESLRADAYFHPYTGADLAAYVKHILPATDPEIISMVAVEAGDDALVSQLGELFVKSPGVYGSVGFSPRNLQHDLDVMDSKLTSALNDYPNMIAVGPIGLDANYSPATMDEQKAQFARQMEIALDFDVPVIFFHNKAFAELRKCMTNMVLPRRLIWLKPIRTQEELDFIQEIDAYVILRAEITHPNFEFYREAIRQMLPQRLLIGSGNSLQASHNRAGHFNTSESLPDILKTVAEVLNIFDPIELQYRVNCNFAHVYGAE